MKVQNENVRENEANGLLLVALLPQGRIMQAI